ncbi:MAG TPA: hypothetical protein VN894_04620 [Polyangiaceae bacterium]|nr:hypothetical protein [Polyangiaceae bacterium]
MALPRKTLRSAVLATAAVFGVTTLGAPLREARADGTSTAKGVAGGAFLGADVVTMVESLVGVRAGWAYGVGALLGAGGGGVGGYFIGHGSDDGKAPTYLLAGGLALIIPAIVLTLNGTRYLPEEGATEDRAPTAPAAEPGVPGGSVTGAPTDVAAPPPPPAPAAPGPASPSSPSPHESKAAPSSGRRGAGAPRPTLVDIRGGAMRLGVPVPDVRPVFSAAEQRQYGMRAEAELRLPVLELIF